MKNLINKLKKIDWLKVLMKLEEGIEHRLFRPVAISIITSFVLFKGFSYLSSWIADYREYSTIKRQATPIKINISNQGINFDVDEDQIIEYRVKAGDTFLKIIADSGADEQDIFNILNATKKVFDPKSIAKGDLIKINHRIKIIQNTGGVEAIAGVSRKVIIENVEIVPSPEQQIIISRKNNGEYEAKEIKVKLTRYISRYFGTLKNGFYVDGVNAGISPTSMMNMINLYSYDVDFQRDIRGGDKFEMLVESFYSEDGKKIKDGDVLFSSLALQDQSKPIEFYLHKIDGRVEYFDAKGNSVRKSLLKTPINGARVSSGFGMRRHPILGYSKMHKGVDFAAGSGTPILAAGSGTISYYGVKGGYGNFVQIRHNADYSTAYGHASRFNRKFHLGSKVKQGDVVAYVGTTGRSTGPHLHFEVLYKGAAINPAKVKATSGLRLSGKEMAAFMTDKNDIEKYRKNIPNQIRR